MTNPPSRADYIRIEIRSGERTEVYELKAEHMFPVRYDFAREQETDDLDVFPVVRTVARGDAVFSLRASTPTWSGEATTAAPSAAGSPA